MKCSILVLVFTAMSLVSVHSARAADPRFRSVVPSGPGAWTAVVDPAGNPEKIKDKLVFTIDGNPVAPELTSNSDGMLTAVFTGVSQTARALELRHGKSLVARIQIGADDSQTRPFNGLTVYHIMVGYFANGNHANDNQLSGWKHANYAGGDLQGVIQGLPHIKDVGANAIWLSPIFDANTSHGYDVENYYRIGDAVGVPGDPARSMQVFQDLVTQAHRMGIKIVLDLPLNHAAKTYDRTTGDPNKLGPKATGPRQDAEKLWESWGGPYQYWDFDHQPTRQFLINVALYWLVEQNVDGLRLDYVRGVPHDFWAELYQAVKQAKPDAFLVGEAWQDQASSAGNAKDIATYYQPVPDKGPQFDSLFDFPLQITMTNSFAKGGSLVEVEEWLQRTAAAYEPEASPSYFLDNHDVARFMSWTPKSERLLAAVGVLASLSSPVVVFYGTETGLSHVGPKTGFIDAGRIPMPWGRFNEPLLESVSAMFAARQAYPPLTHGARLPLYADKDVLVMAKYGPAQTALVCVNLSNAHREVAVPAGVLLDGRSKQTWAIGGGTIVAADGQIKLNLPPVSTNVLICEQ